MAKHKKRSKGRKDIAFAAISVTENLAVGALVNNTAIFGALIAALGDDFYAISADLMWTMVDGTGGQGPVEVGVAHGDYTIAEVKEYLDVDMSDPGNLIAKEQNRRLIRRAGIFNVLSGAESLFDGQAKRLPLKFVINEGSPFNMWLMNRSGGTLTTGMLIRVSGTVFGRWLY